MTDRTTETNSAPGTRSSEAASIEVAPDPAASIPPTGMAALPGEPGIPGVARQAPGTVSIKGVVSVSALVLSVIAVAAFWIARIASHPGQADDDATLTANRPTSATADPKKIDLTLSRPASSAVATTGPAPVTPTTEPADAAGNRATQAVAPSPGVRPPAPEDAAVMLLTTRPTAALRQPSGGAATSSDGERDHVDGSAAAETGDSVSRARRNLQAYQHQLQELMESLGHDTPNATNSPLRQPAPTSGATASPSAASPPAATPRGPRRGGTASTLGDRSLTLPRGTNFTCALQTKVVSATSGLVSCQVQRNVYSENGRVLLIERGSHLDGEYAAASIRPGTVRIPVVWTRVRTTAGVIVDIDSPGTGALGESGVDGEVDNRWFERLGAAMLLSVIDDSVQLIVQDHAGAANGSGNTFVFPATTANASKLAEKVLDSTINIPPLIYRNQGGIVGIVVAHDVDFSGVYQLQPTSDRGQP